MTYKVFCNGFWSGFHDCTNGVNERFVLDLLKEIYQTDNVILTFLLEEANILFENVRANECLVHAKKWVHTYLFSGEQYTRENQHEYSCVLRGERNHSNVINCPLYVAYLHSSFEGKLPLATTNGEIPQACYNRGSWPGKDVLVMISNDRPCLRLDFCNELEKAGFQITYAGNYKNNIGGAFQPYMTSTSFLDLVKQHKFCLSMENSEGDTYITEKILHPLLAHTMPIYWGSPRILDYVQKERILHVQNNTSFPKIIQEMRTMTSGEWRVRTESLPLTPFGASFSVKSIARDVRGLLFKGRFPLVSQTVFLCNESFEKERYAKLQTMCSELRLSKDTILFHSPSYKHTITDKEYSLHVRDTDKLRLLRSAPLRKAELSLTWNWRSALENIEKRFGGDPEALFFLFESDVFALSNVYDLDSFLQTWKAEAKTWDMCHIGGVDSPVGQNFYHPRLLPWRSDPTSLQLEKGPEGMFRKCHTRCTDAFVMTYRGVQMLLTRLLANSDYAIPFDYYLSEFTYDNPTFRHFWSWPTFFDQRSNRGLEESTVQTS